MGLGQTLLLAGIHAFGYIAPAAKTQIITQLEAVRTFFGWCFAGLPMLSYMIFAAIMLFYHLDQEMEKADTP